MTTNLIYTRYFNQVTVKKNEFVQVVFELSFISPITPSTNIWFDNLGDNLGGSKESNGPLSYRYRYPPTFTNLLPTSFQVQHVGDGSNQGCLRFWTGSDNYPSATSPLSEVWKPINPGMVTTLRMTSGFRVDPNAVIGTVITLPTWVSPTSNTNLDANKMMLDFGSGFNLIINNNPPGSSTLTIIE